MLAIRLVHMGGRIVSAIEECRCSKWLDAQEALSGLGHDQPLLICTES
jgi:hypothetical protein